MKSVTSMIESAVQWLRRRGRKRKVVSIETEDLIGLLDEAEARLRSIESASVLIRNREFSGYLERIVAGAREILREIETNPADARRARKFLKVYLDGAEQVIAGYAQEHRGEDAPAIEDKFRRVLGAIEGVIEEQQRKLGAGGMGDLDVKIEVLREQIEHEGIG